MKKSILSYTITIKIVLSSVLLVSGLSMAQAKDLPQTTVDGLNLVESTEMRVVYMKPGASLAQYKRVALIDCRVAFKKNWQRDHNRQERGLSRKISDDDMEKIKKRVADEFRKIFTKVLEDDGHEVVTTAAEDVLIISPAIINLVVTAPDTISAGMGRTFTASAGQMTLYMELYDSLTSDIIFKVLDPQAADNLGGFNGFSASNRVTNTAEADRILRKWANTLSSHLGAVETR